MPKQPFDVGQGQQATGRSVRVGEDDAAVRAQIIGDAQREILGQGYGDVLDAVQAAVDRVEAVSDIGEQQRRGVLKQGLKDVGQHFVRAVADENLRRRDLVIVGDGSFQSLGVRVRVQAQRIGQLAPDRFQHLGRRAVRVFVGVELDEVVELGLLARHVGGEPANDRTPVGIGHGRSGIRHSAERAWAVKPSPRARIDAVRPSVAAPAGELLIRLVRF